MRKYAELKDGKIKIHFPFTHSTLALVRTLTNRDWNTTFHQKWACPILIENIEKLLQWEFAICPELRKIWKQMNTTQSIVIDINKTPKFNEIWSKLYSFQKEGVEFIESNGGRALIGDEMGLGKTIQAIAWLAYHPKARPALIIPPASLKINWMKEISKWTGESVCVVEGKTSMIPTGSSFYIINYDIIYNSETVGKKKVVNLRYGLKELKPKALVIDESHYIKNSKAARTKAIKLLGKIAPKIIELSGTPIVNRPVEFFNALNLIDPERWPNEYKFKYRYCNPKFNGFGWEFNGATNVEELHKKLQYNMIRRLKKDVLKDLPPKIRSVVPLELSNHKEYKIAEVDLIQWVRQIDGDEAAKKVSNAEQLVRFEKLKQLAVKGKMEAFQSWCLDYLESNEKLLIFADHRNDPMNVVGDLNSFFNEKGFKTSVCVGGMKPEEKEKNIQAFNNDPSVRVLIGTKSMKEGHSITATSNVVFAELWWTPGDHDQAEDRVYGISRGDGSNQVNAFYLLAEGTIETEIAEMLDEKRKVLSAVVDGKNVEESSLLSELSKRYKLKEIK